MRLRLSVAAARCEILVAELGAAGCIGIETCEEGADVVLEAYFTAAAWTGADPAWLAATESRLLAQVWVEDRDWLESYRQSIRPFRLGRRFVVDPREPGSAAPTADSRTLLRLPARRAFGVGSHETTRLAIELLESLFDDPELAVVVSSGRAQVLDLGCGTGVLALAARVLGARTALAIDSDPAAAFAVRENARLNRQPLQILAGSQAALAAPTSFDVVLANILPEHLEGAEAALSGKIRPGGLLVLSGVLREKSDEVLERWRNVGLAPVREAKERDWVAWILRSSS